MKLKTKKSRIILLIIIIIVVILVLGMILLILNAQPTTAELALEKLAYINDDNQWSDETIYPDYAAAFGRAYKGDLTIKNIGKSMYYVSTELFPKYYEELKNSTEEEIGEYFEKNFDSIHINLAINNKSKFVNLIKKLQSLSGDTIIFESYRIDLDSIHTGASYAKAVLYITYQGNEEISFNVIANNKVSSNYSTLEYLVSVNN